MPIKLINIDQVPDEETIKTPTASEELSELSHVNEGETGFNPTVAEMASVFKGIKAEIEALKE